MIRLRIAVLSASLAAASIAAFSSSNVLAAPSLYAVNLVVNGDAESDTGAPNSTTIVPPKGWVTTGQVTAVKYGASGGYPDATSPGPKERGRNFFSGGNVEKSTATQSIDLAAAAADVDAGTVTYAFSAWLGGYSTQDDNTVATVTFADANGTSLGAAKLGPVMPADRKAITGLLSRKQSGAVPKGARSAVVTLVMTRLEGTANDGYADNVSLVLAKTTK